MELLLASEQGRPEQSDVVLQDLVNIGNFKQALANVDKRLRKGKKDKLLVNRALILLAMPGLEKRLLGKRELSELLEKEQLISDANFLRVVDHANVSSGGLLQDQIEDMWERAVKVSSSNDDVLFEWLARTLASMNYKVAQRAAMFAMSKNRNHKTLFQAILCCYLASAMPGTEIPARDRAMYGTMADRFLSKAASDSREFLKVMQHAVTGSATTQSEGKGPRNSIPNDPSSRSFQTVGDVSFYTTIMIQQGHFREAVETIYPDDSMSTLFQCCQGNFSVILDMLEMLEKSGQWRRLFDLSKDILLDACAARGLLGNHTRRLALRELGDDWKVWRAYALGLKHLTDSDAWSKHNDWAAMFERLSVRHSLLSRLELRLVGSESGEVKEEASDAVLSSLQWIFDRFGDTAVVLRDLRGFRCRISRLTMLKFVLTTSKSLEDQLESYGNAKATNTQVAQRCVIREGHSLALDYQEVVARPENLGNHPLLEAFIGTCLRLYRLSLKIGTANSRPMERRCGDSAAILAAMACVHLYRQKHDNSMLRAILILEELLCHSQHNYSAQVLLVRLYCQQGAITKAYEHYKRLDVKNIQALTFAWVLFPRICTIYSGKTPRHAFDPRRELNLHLNWIERINANAQKATGGLLKEGQWLAVLSQCRMYREYARSTSSFLLLVEAMRANPDRAQSIEEVQGLVEQVDSVMTDTRDLGVSPWRDTEDRCLEDFLSTGPWPKATWCLFEARVVCLRNIMRSNDLPQNGRKLLQDWATEILETQDVLFNIRPYDEVKEAWADLTTSERTQYRVTHIIWYVVVSVTNTRDLRDLEDIILAVLTAGGLLALDVDATAKFAEDPEANLRQHGWQIFHALHARLETARLWISVLHFLAAQDAKMSRTFKDEILGRLSAASATWETMRTDLIDGATKLKASFRGPGVGEMLHTDAVSGEDEVSREMAKFDSGRLQRRCWEFATSMVNTIDTLLLKLDYIDVDG